jgi:hypothetical protein
MTTETSARCAATRLSASPGGQFHRVTSVPPVTGGPRAHLARALKPGTRHDSPGPVRRVVARGLARRSGSGGRGDASVSPGGKLPVESKSTALATTRAGGVLRACSPRPRGILRGTLRPASPTGRAPRTSPDLGTPVTVPRRTDGCLSFLRSSVRAGYSKLKVGD